MFGILEGEVEVRLPNGAVRRLGPDNTFGEMAIVDTSPRSATTVAVTDTKLAVIDTARDLSLVQETPNCVAGDVESRRAPSGSGQLITACLTLGRVACKPAGEELPGSSLQRLAIAVKLSDVTWRQRTGRFPRPAGR